MSNVAIVIPKFATQYFSYPHFKTRRLVGSLNTMTRRTISIIILAKLPNRAYRTFEKKINKQKTQMSEWFHDWCLLGVVNEEISRWCNYHSVLKIMHITKNSHLMTDRSRIASNILCLWCPIFINIEEDFFNHSDF